VSVHVVTSLHILNLDIRYWAVVNSAVQADGHQNYYIGSWEDPEPAWVRWGREEFVPLQRIELFACCLLLHLVHRYVALLERNSYATITSFTSDENIIIARDSYINNNNNNNCDGPITSSRSPTDCVKIQRKIKSLDTIRVRYKRNGYKIKNNNNNKHTFNMNNLALNRSATCWKYG
jgi:hypothetical protein